MNVERKVEICTELNIMSESLSDKYLGLLAMIGAERSDSFRYLLVIARLKGWKEKWLSL